MYWQTYTPPYLNPHQHISTPSTHFHRFRTPSRRTHTHTHTHTRAQLHTTLLTKPSTLPYYLDCVHGTEATVYHCPVPLTDNNCSINGTIQEIYNHTMSKLAKSPSDEYFQLVLLSWNLDNVRDIVDGLRCSHRTCKLVILINITTRIKYTIHICIYIYICIAFYRISWNIMQ